MKKSLFIAALTCSVLLLLACSAAIADMEPQVIFRSTPCGNGYGGAYTVTTIDAGGCIYSIVGIDCLGGAINWHAPVVKQLAGDLTAPYTHFFSGVSNGRTWFAKVQISETGEVAKAWGQTTNGMYYMLSLALTP